MERKSKRFEITRGNSSKPTMVSWIRRSHQPKFRMKDKCSTCSAEGSSAVSFKIRPSCMESMCRDSLQMMTTGTTERRRKRLSEHRSQRSKNEANLALQDQRYLDIKNNANLGDIDKMEAQNEVNFLKYLVIEIDADWKGYFDMVMLICACENTIM